LKAGVRELPTIGDGRQSGTSGSPSILNASPESAIGGGLLYLKTNDIIRIDLNKRTANIVITKEELAKRRKEIKLPNLVSNTPWEEIYRANVGQLSTGGCLEMALKYQRVSEGLPRNNH
jgi:dihydroxy-acid dehydratase